MVYNVRPMTTPASDERPVPPMPLWVLALAFAGAMSALAGGYWDDAWHTERGRDEFFIAPHIAIYAGVAGAGAALSLWALLVARSQGTAAVWRHRPLALAMLSVAVTLASGPIDNAWHVAFGRDAVIWSPPHMLGIAGTLALGAAALAEVAGRRDRWRVPMTAAAGGLVLAAAGFTVAEYDTDVPQFDEAFYLPALGLAAAIGLSIVRTAARERWAATAAATVHTVFIAAVGAFLALVDFPPPALPLLLPAAVVVDLAARRRWHPAATAAAFTAALHVAYVPVRNLVGDGVTFDAADVAAGAVLCGVASLVVFAVAAGVRPARPARAQAVVSGIAALATVVALAGPPDAEAHDPGQGEDAGAVALRVDVAGHTARVAGRLPDAVCATTEPVAVVARRAGETRRGALRRDGCDLRGTVRLDGDGRWFVYAELRRDGSAVESWLPVIVRDGAGRIADGDRYAYVPPEGKDTPLKVAGGIVLYGGMFALLYATLVLARGAGGRSAGAGLGELS